MTIVLAAIDAGRWAQVSSRIAEIETRAMPDEIRRRRVLQLLPDDIIPLPGPLFDRARQLVERGLGAADALHVAAAEALQADVFLTCDDRLLRRCRRLADKLAVNVANPIQWLAEQDDASNAQ